MQLLHNDKIVDEQTISEAIKQSKSSILTHGMFDLLHPGHVDMLCTAKNLADILIVGIDSDGLTQAIKGEGRPIRIFEERAYMVASLECVDYVFKIEPENYHCDMTDYFTKLYKGLVPSMIATTIAAGEHGKLKQSQSEEAGVKFVDLSHTYNSDFGTTRLINKILGQHK